MSRTRTASDVLERDFLEIRSRILDLAAAMDRLDRAAERPRIDSDPRLDRLRSAVETLLKPGAGRAEAIQLLFSDPYEEDWLKRLPIAPRAD